MNMFECSSDSDDEAKNQKSFQRDQSSGAFQLIEITVPDVTTIIHISTNRDNIILDKPLKPVYIHNTQQWDEKFQQAILGHNIDSYTNIIYSICRGLTSTNKIRFWSCMTQQKMSQLTLKQSNSLNQKYNSSIAQCLLKLKQRMQPLFKSDQLMDILKLTQQVLVNYYGGDPEVGFCKSMQYLAFSLIVTLKQSQNQKQTLLENVDCYFSYILRKKKLRDMYFPGYPGIFTKIKQLQQSIKQQLPQLYKLISNTGKQWQHLFFKHYLTIFMHKIPYRSVIPKLIELLVLEGYNIITYILKRILQQTRGKLLKMDKNKLEEHLINNIFDDYLSNFKQSQISECLFDLLVKVEIITK